ncbi:unnamed protein product [Paramecium octaurelia]|uniref:Uncharacterized protein n=1 Tax=Paramecium octaurelia TaxID=43137 RepID=A0A8S1TEF7_PAROT|nr:unnamed protein product [Paramecium octaurelia]
MNINSWKIGPFPQILWLPQNCVCVKLRPFNTLMCLIQKSLECCQREIRNGQQTRRLERDLKGEDRERNEKGHYWNVSMLKKKEQENLDQRIELDFRNRKLEMESEFRFGKVGKKRKKEYEITNCAYRQIFINRVSYHNGMKLAQQN